MQSLELLTLAESNGATLAELSRRIGLNPNALHAARNVGKLSPAVAALLAAELNENVAIWTLAALAENARNAPMRRKLTALAKTVNSYFHELRTRRPPRPSRKRRPYFLAAS